MRTYPRVLRHITVVGFVSVLCCSGAPLVARDALRTKPLATTRADGEVEVVVIDPPQSSWSQVQFVAIHPATQPYVDDYLNVVRTELARHSSELLRRVGLKQVALVRYLTVNEQPRAAVPDYPQGVLYFDPWYGNERRLFQRHVIHHELFHFIQGSLHGDASYKRPAWIALHDPPFKYGDGGARMRAKETSVLFHPAAGFINLYAQSAVEEDMAEVFAALYVPAEREKVEAWAKEDRILQAKIVYMRDLVARYEKGE